MSVEKEAAFLGALGNFVKRRAYTVSKEVRRAAPYIQQSGDAGGLSLHRSIIDSLAKADAFGAKNTSKAFTKFDQLLTKADTGLGAAIRGDTKSGIWHNMWTSKDKYRIHEKMVKGRKVLVPGAGPKGSPVLYKEIERPSIMKPVAATGSLAVGTLAQMKGTELLDSLRSKPQQ